MSPTVHLPADVRAVVFDLDGLLVDTEVLWREEEAGLLSAHGVEHTREDSLATVGRAIDHSVAYLAWRIGRPPSAVPELRRELMARMRTAFADRLAPMPGAIGLVRGLADAGLPMAVASNTDRDLVRLALERAGLSDVFDAVVSAEDVEHPKPAPDVYLRACQALGVAPSEALAFEDSESGIVAARAAGLRVYAVPQLVEMDVSAADRVLESLEELLT
ncbi:MAG TPA: HAD family phosphatase [Candidatus Dormibacteraeota bacterium]|nr:HAD family phosphatase [Candidatus Dormibacteraeota bacterium]